MSRRAGSFDRLARPYRALEFAAFGRDLERARFRFLDRLAGARSILLLGEGDGRCSARLAALAPAARLHCIDSSPAMIERARFRLAGTAARSRVEWTCTDVGAWEFPAASYDAVTTFFFLDCFSPEEVEGIVARVNPALRSDAAWLHADFIVPARGFARLRARAWLSALYAFFRWQTGLRTNRLPPSGAILENGGWREEAAEEYQSGLVRSAVYGRR